MENKNPHSSVTRPPPPVPAGFSPESFFNGVHWHQGWEIFQGVVVPGYNPVKDLCDHVQIPSDLSGKRVLDVGAWNGCFSFECERRGAKEVVAFSLEDPAEVGFDRLKKILDSKVQYVKGSAYALSPREIGMFDVVLFLGVLYHLRYPLLAIDRLRSVTRGEIFVETHVIDNHLWLRGPGGIPTSVAANADLQRTPIWRQYREFELGPKDYSNWFGPNIAAVLEGFETAGFEIAHTQSWGKRAAFRGKATTIPARLIQHTYEANSLNSDFVGLKQLES
jgi:tRNA (mo5U34)-methyltransferase